MLHQPKDTGMLLPYHNPLNRPLDKHIWFDDFILNQYIILMLMFIPYVQWVSARPIGTSHISLGRSSKLSSSYPFMNATSKRQDKSKVLTQSIKKNINAQLNQMCTRKKKKHGTWNDRTMGKYTGNYQEQIVVSKEKDKFRVSTVVIKQARSHPL